MPPSSRPWPLIATEIDLADRIGATRRLASNVCRIGDYHLGQVMLNGEQEVTLRCLCGTTIRRSKR
jgi:hypothetical protein